MIYTNNSYQLAFYIDPKIGKAPVLEYLNSLGRKDRAKITKYMEVLRASEGYLSEPYSRHITGKIRELRVDFARNRHRIFYFTFVNKKIVMLRAFLKKTKKTPEKEINMALKYYHEILNNNKKI